MRKVIAGVLAIATFTAAAIAAVWLLTASGGAPPAATAAAPASQAIPEPVPAAPPLGLPPPLPPPKAGPEPKVVMGPPAPVPQAGSWETARVAARPGGLGAALAGPVMRGLDVLRPQLAACFDEETEARFGRESVTRTQNARRGGGGGTTILMLQIETGGGEARIVDAPVEMQGRAGDGAIACAQSVLRGQRFAAPGAAPGQRVRLRHQLMR